MAILFESLAAGAWNVSSMAYYYDLLSNTAMNGFKANINSVYGAQGFPREPRSIFATTELIPDVPIGANNADGLPYQIAMVPEMPRFLQAWNAADMAMIFEVGPLREHDTRFVNGSFTRPIPSAIMAHDKQQDQWMAANALATSTGFGGRLIDEIASRNSWTAAQRQFATLSVGGSQLSGVSPSGPAVNVLSNGVIETYRQLAAKFANGAFDGIPTAAFNQLINATGADYSGGLADTHYRYARETGTALNAEQEALQGILATPVTVGGTPNWEPDLQTPVQAAMAAAGFTATRFNNFTIQYETILKLIARYASGALQCPDLFICCLLPLAWDTHGKEALQFPEKIVFTDTLFHHFHEAVKLIGVWNQFVHRPISDFDRTWRANGTTDNAGTDHAWSSHQFVFGGPVIGRRFFGIPTAVTGISAANPYMFSDGGRRIPRLGQERARAMQAIWMARVAGANDNVASEIANAVLPNLSVYPNTTPAEVPGTVAQSGPQIPYLALPA